MVKKTYTPEQIINKLREVEILISQGEQAPVYFWSQRGGACKSGQFAYYRCGKALRQGPKACPGHWFPRAAIEGFIIDKIKTYILTDDNLRELVELTNEEIHKLSESSEEKVKTLEVQIKDIDSRLDRLYDALETGKLDLGELAPRISDLISRKKDLQQAN